MNRYIAVAAIAASALFFIDSAGAQAVSVITLTNGPPNLSAGLIPAGMPTGSPVSDVYADNVGNTPFTGSFNQPTGANASSFSISTVSNCGSAGNITCGKLATKGVLAAGTYNITLTTSRGGSQNVTIQAVSGTAVGCPSGASDSTVSSAANAAGNGATLIFPACSYSWSNGVKALTNQRWVGIPGQTIFDAHGNEVSSGACGDKIMVCGYNAGTTGVTIANLTLQNVGTNFSNPVGCQPGGSGSLPDCPYRDYMISTNDGWTVQNTVLQNSDYGGLSSQGTSGGSGTVNLINDVVTNAGGWGCGNPACPATINIIGNDQTGNNPSLQNPCNGAGNKFLDNNFTLNMKYNYFHHNPAPALWEDSYSGQTFTISGNTFITSGDGAGAAGALLFENDPATSGDIGFNVFIDNGNSASSPTGNDPVCGGEGSPGSAVQFQPAQNFTLHDNNISTNLGPSTPYGQWAGGTVVIGEECVSNDNANLTIANNSITFKTTSPGSGNQAAFGSTYGNCPGGNPPHDNVTASGDTFHYAYSGASANDAHFNWPPNWGTPIVSLAQFQSNYGQEIGSTIDFTDKTANGCLHVACAVNPVGPGGVQQAPTATLAMQNITLSNNTFTPNVANGVVGTVSVTMSDGSAFSGTLSITGTNSGGFHLSGNTLEEKASGGTPAGSYNDFNIVATQSSASNSPQQISPTVSGVAEAPFGGTVRTITNRIQAEDFDLGGYGVAYHATDACGIGIDTAYGPDRLNVYPTADLDGESNLKIGCNQAGDWHNYTITVPNNGSYTISMRVANITAGSTYHVAIDGVSAVQGIAVPNTGGYDAFATATSAPFALTAGKHVMQIVLDTGSTGGFGGDLNWMQGTLVKPGTGTTKNIDITVTH